MSSAVGALDPYVYNFGHWYCHVEFYFLRAMTATQVNFFYVEKVSIKTLNSQLGSKCKYHTNARANSNCEQYYLGSFDTSYEFEVLMFMMRKRGLTGLRRGYNRIDLTPDDLDIFGFRRMLQ